jgi:hypothetical protein
MTEEKKAKTEKVTKSKPKQPALPGMPKPGRISVVVEEFFELKDDAKGISENIKNKKIEIISEMKKDNVRHVQVLGYSFTINASETLTVKKEGGGKKGKKTF